MFSVKATTERGVTELVRLGRSGVERLDPEQDGRKATRFERLKDAEEAVLLLHATAEGAGAGEPKAINGMRLGVAQTDPNPGTKPAVVRISGSGGGEERGAMAQFVHLWNGSGPCRVSDPAAATIFGDAASAEGTAAFAGAWCSGLTEEGETLKLMYCRRQPEGERE